MRDQAKKKCLEMGKMTIRSYCKCGRVMFTHKEISRGLCNQCARAIKKEIKTELCRGCMYDAVCAGNDSGISPCPEFVEIPYCELCGTSHPNGEPCPPGPY